MILSRRTLQLVVLAGWSLCLLALWLGGEVDQYLGPRTAWVVPVGGITLSLATVAYAAFTEEGPVARQRPGATDWLGSFSLAVPILAAFAMHGASLGSLAASNKLSSRGVDLSSLISKQASSSGPTTLLNLSLAQEHPAKAASFGVHDGGLVQLQGFVFGSPRRADGSFQLARIYITCCVADSIALNTRIMPPKGSPRLTKDTWLTVDGVVQGRGRGLSVRAVRVRRIAKPSDPYLTFTS